MRPEIGSNRGVYELDAHLTEYTDVNTDQDRMPFASQQVKSIRERYFSDTVPEFATCDVPPALFSRCYVILEIESKKTSDS